jgi:hypothetical protein
MIDSRSSINHSEPAHSAAGIYDGAGHYDCSCAKADVARNCRARMHRDRQTAPIIQHLQREMAAQCAFTDPNNDSVFCQKIWLYQAMVIADHRHAINYRTRRVIVEEAGYMRSLAAQNIGDDTSVATAAEHHYRS